MAENLNNLSFDELVPSKSDYLKKEDVGEGGVILTIRGFKRETLKDDDGNAEEKIVMYFQEADYKPMIVNRTNAQLIANATGASIAQESINKQIVIYSDPNVSFGGKITGGLRIKKYSTVQPKQARTAGQAMEDLESDIPF